nr:MAG TPA: hypothetical protein [Caudoviricetes sp.]
MLLFSQFISQSILAFYSDFQTMLFQSKKVKNRINKQLKAL